MKLVVACLVLAVAVAGCGSKSAGWQDEWREQTRRDLNNPEILDPADLLLACPYFETDEGRELIEQEMLAEIANDDDDGEYVGSGRPLDEILADAGLERNVKTLNEAVQILLDELERPCP